MKLIILHNKLTIKYLNNDEGKRIDKKYMKDKLKWIFKNLHLIFSILIVMPTAIIYGSPTILPERLDIQVNTIDLANMLKSLMFLYLGISIIWLIGIWKSNYWKIATQLNILFMLSLASGRILSIAIDGLPTKGFIFAVIAEIIIGIFSIYQLKKHNSDWNKTPEKCQQE